MPVGFPLEGAAAGVTVSVAGSDAAVVGSPELPSDAAGEMQPRRLRGWRRRGLDGLVEEERERGRALRELDGETRERGVVVEAAQRREDPRRRRRDGEARGHVEQRGGEGNGDREWVWRAGIWVAVRKTISFWQKHPLTLCFYGSPSPHTFFGPDRRTQ